MRERVNGKFLNAADQAFILKYATSRYTLEHVPYWVNTDINPPRFATDREFIENTDFHVDMSGRVDNRLIYKSEPTWPRGKTYSEYQLWRLCNLKMENLR